jgi:hypothetical protein
MLDDDECGAVGGINGKGNRWTRRRPALLPLCWSQIPHNLTRARTRAAAVRSQLQTLWVMTPPIRWVIAGTDAPIILGRRPSLSAHESGSMLRNYLVGRERERYRQTARGRSTQLLITAVLLPQRLSCYLGKIVSLRMLTNLRLADLRLNTAQQRSTGQNLPSDLYKLWPFPITSVQIRQ